MALFALCGVHADRAFAANMVVTPDDHARFGTPVQFKVENIAGPVASLYWTIEHFQCPGWIDYPFDHNLNPQTLNGFIPGTYIVKCKITYSEIPGPGGVPIILPPETVTGGIDVMPPDGLRIASGEGVETPFGQHCVVRFVVRCSNQDVGYLFGHVQERIINLIDPITNKVYTLDSDWKPLLGDSNPDFYIEGNAIRDNKMLSASPDWAARNVGDTLLEGTQHIRILFVDDCETVSVYELATYNITVKKSSATGYKIFH